VEANKTLTVSSAISFSGLVEGAGTGTGTIAVEGAGAIGACTIGGSAELIDDGAITQGSAVSIGGGNATIPSLLIDGTWTMDSVTDILIANANSYVQVDGNFICDIPSTLSGSGKVTTPVVLDSGTITAMAGTLDLENSVTVTPTLTGAGYLHIGSSASLEVDSSVSSGVQIYFDAASGTLSVGKSTIASFGATIYNFSGSDDTIDLLHTTANSATLNGSSLVIKNGSRIIVTLQLAGTFGSSFTTSKDGSHGTYIKLTPDTNSASPNAAPPIQAPSAQLMTMAMAGMVPSSGVSISYHDPVAIHPWTLTGPRTQLA